MEKLCVNYGANLGSLNDDHVYFDFPSPQALAEPAVEQKLRQLGFGYRAKYIQATAHIIAHQKPAEWLTSLRRETYPTAKESLLQLPGVGPKVADCVVCIPIEMFLSPSSASSASINLRLCQSIHTFGRLLPAITSSVIREGKSSA